jgi:riboflavin biosynthesis pyrimidine reductase
MDDPLAQPLLRLYPVPHAEVALCGLYLAHRLHALGRRGRAIVYTNFIASLDGRIALPDPRRGVYRVPKQVTNARDWRLFQELAAQADLLITSGRYLRDVGEGGAQAPLPLSTDRKYEELLRWRTTHGLPQQPAVAILSASLDFPLPRSLLAQRRPIVAFTGARADAARVRALERRGVRVQYAGSGARVEGRALMRIVTDMGFRSVYSVAGPEVLHTLLTADALDRLYLTQTHQLLAGDAYDTLLKGAPLHPPAEMHLLSAYYDPHAPAGAGQTLSTFERRCRT